MPFAIIALPVLLCLALGIFSGLRAERKMRP
jgi:hypothetical protein